MKHGNPDRSGYRHYADVPLAGENPVSICGERYNFYYKEDSAGVNCPECLRILNEAGYMPILEKRAEEKKEIAKRKALETKAEKEYEIAKTWVGKRVTRTRNKNIDVEGREVSKVNLILTDPISSSYAVEKFYRDNGYCVEVRYGIQALPMENVCLTRAERKKEERREKQMANSGKQKEAAAKKNNLNKETALVRGLIARGAKGYWNRASNFGSKAHPITGWDILETPSSRFGKHGVEASDAVRMYMREKGLQSCVFVQYSHHNSCALDTFVIKESEDGQAEGKALADQSEKEAKETRGRLVDIARQETRAKSYIGKTIKYFRSPTGKTGKGKSYEICRDRGKYAASSIRRAIDKYGYCVVVKFAENGIAPVRDLRVVKEKEKRELNKKKQSRKYSIWD